jgi:hypothetical protein
MYFVLSRVWRGKYQVIITNYRHRGWRDAMGYGVNSLDAARRFRRYLLGGEK